MKYQTCPECYRDVMTTRTGFLSMHKNRMKKGEPTCAGSGQPRVMRQGKV